MNDYPIYKKCALSRSSRFWFHWESGSLNDNGIEILKRHEMKFCYICFSLHVLIRNRWCPVEYKKISGDHWEMIIWHL